MTSVGLLGPGIGGGAGTGRTGRKEAGWGNVKSECAGAWLYGEIVEHKSQ